MAVPTPSSRWQRVYLLGDSLTQQSFSLGGWGARLADGYQRQFDVINRGFSGYTSAYVAGILPRLAEEDQLLLRGDVAAAVVTLGCNDAVLEVDPRHIPVDQYIHHMRTISAQLVEAGVPVEKQVFVGTPPVAEAKWADHCKSLGREMNLSNDNTRLYSEALSKLAAEIGVARFVELHSAVQRVDDWQNLLSDGLHLSPSGNEFVAEKIAQALVGVLPAAQPAYPLWDAIDPKNPPRLDKA
ncbi:isoamyl acetate-hydrolyzing esterase 1 homolog [Sycon ciliatum]|uniref:isoamyl acetate-hydrolyzing esterase 1 homolog n=1 Tax=Sycon ciliatum TaxID=27933 RepID=UPI0031F69555